MKKAITILAACMLVFSFAGMVSAQCVTCETDPGHINRGCVDVPEQGSCTTTPFDYEDFGICSEQRNSYCESAEKGDLHRALIQICECIPDPFSDVLEGEVFDIGLTILVDKKDGNGPVEGNNGVYWAQDVNAGRVGIRMQTFANQGAACSNEECVPNAAFRGQFEYLLADGTTTDELPYTGTECDVPSEQEIVAIMPVLNQQGPHGYRVTENDAVTNASVWWIDIPMMRVDQNITQAGWDVYAEICLYESLETGGVCGACEGCCCLIKIGTLCCVDTLEECEDTLIFPYLGRTDGAWWNGIAVTNLGSVSGTASVTLYENDGNVFTGTVTIAGNSTRVIDPNADLSGSGTIGDEKGYAVVVTDGFAASGFAMMAKEANGVSMGYLAEKVINCNSCTSLQVKTCR